MRLSILWRIMEISEGVIRLGPNSPFPFSRLQPRLYHAGLSSLVLFVKAFSLTSFEVKIRLNKAFRFLIFSKREKERDFLDLPLVSSRCGTFDRGWLCCSRIDTDGFWFSPCWAGFVRRVKSMFAGLNRGTCRGCNCSFNELVRLAQVTNFPATWVTDPIRMLHEMKKRQSNFFTNFSWHWNNFRH